MAFASTWLLSCSEEEPTLKIHPKIEVEDEKGEKAALLEFPAVPALDDEVEGTLFARSLTVATLQIVGMEVKGEGAAHFEPVETAFTVPAKGRTEFAIVFRPQAVGDHTATLVIRSDDPYRPEVEVTLKGRGIDSAIQVEGCLPSTPTDKERCSRTFVTAPDTLSLGRVVAGTSEPARITVTNLGRKALELKSVVFENPDEAKDWGFTIPPRAGGQTIAGLSTGGFNLGFDPPKELVREVEVVLIIESSDRSRPTLRFPIRANVVPNEPPAACIKLHEFRPLMGAPRKFLPGEEAVISPGDSIVFSARAREGCTSDPEDGEDLDLEWSIEGTDGFTYELIDEGDPFEALFHSDVIGSFTVRLVATDKVGQSADADEEGNPAELHFRVEPREDIGLEIRWPEGKGADLDIHLVLQDGINGVFGHRDFYWNNQGVTWGPNPPLSNPRLLDDKGGRMVETVLLNQPEDGKLYSLFVHFRKDGRAGRTTARSCSPTVPCPDPQQACSMTTDDAGVCMEPVDVQARLFILREEKDLSSIAGARASAVLGSPCDVWWIGNVRWGPAPTFEPGPPNILAKGDGVSEATCFIND